MRKGRDRPAAVYLRPARGVLMVGGFEPGPLPLDPRHQPASFSTDLLQPGRRRLDELAVDPVQRGPRDSRSALR